MSSPKPFKAISLFKNTPILARTFIAVHRHAAATFDAVENKPVLGMIHTLKA
jgi:hypothetical protein